MERFRSCLRADEVSYLHIEGDERWRRTDSSSLPTGTPESRKERVVEFDP